MLDGVRGAPGGEGAAGREGLGRAGDPGERRDGDEERRMPGRSRAPGGETLGSVITSAADAGGVATTPPQGVSDVPRAALSARWAVAARSGAWALDRAVRRNSFPVTRQAPAATSGRA
jgi:hypothetical protein